MKSPARSRLAIHSAIVMYFALEYRYDMIAASLLFPADVFMPCRTDTRNTTGHRKEKIKKYELYYTDFQE
jgi:hypothetical protein